MYSRDVTITLSIFMWSGTVLQLVGFFLPAWAFSKLCYEDACTQTSLGLWFFVQCTDDSGCTTGSYFNEPLHGGRIIVGFEVVATLSIVMSIFASTLTVAMLCLPSKAERLSLSSTLVIFISGAFIWPIIGQYAALQSYRIEYIFPYGLFLSAVGSVIVLAIGCIHSIKLLNILPRGGMTLLQEEE